MNFGCHSFFSGLFEYETIPPGILSFPELPNGFRSLIQPFTICQQRNQFDGAEKLHRVRVRPAQRPQLASGDENGNIFRRTVQQLRHLCREQLTIPTWSHFILKNFRLKLNLSNSAENLEERSDFGLE
jgi:hypothetical protein